MPPGDENNPTGKIKHWKTKETPKGLGQRSFRVLLRQITQAETNRVSGMDAR